MRVIVKKRQICMPQALNQGGHAQVKVKFPVIAIFPCIL